MSVKHTTKATAGLPTPPDPCQAPTLTPKPPLVRTAARGEFSAGIPHTLCPRAQLSPVLRQEYHGSGYHFNIMAIVRK